MLGCIYSNRFPAVAIFRRTEGVLKRKDGIIMTDSEKLDLLLNKMQSMEESIGELKSDVQTLKSDVQALKSDVQTLKSDVQTLKSDVQTLKSDMVQVKRDIKALQKTTENLNFRLQKVELMLENETNKNIRLVAEGHYDLYRKLNDSLKVREKDELLQIRVNTLERKVKELQDVVFAKPVTA